MDGHLHRNELRLILGLGNPGRTYRGTRHNRGREVVLELARRRGMALSDETCGSLSAAAEDLILAVPETFMNRSGHAARCLLETREVNLDQLLVVYDDVALPLGRLRLRTRGGPGGQKGMASVIESLQSDAISRLRLGIAPRERAAIVGDLTEFVLSSFEEDERTIASEQIEAAVEACELWLSEGAASAMNKYNDSQCNEQSVDCAVKEEKPKWII